MEGAPEPPTTDVPHGVDIEAFGRASLHQDPDFAEKFVASVGGQERLSGWEMLYCGGAQPVVDALKDIKHNYGIALKVEKFDW